MISSLTSIEKNLQLAARKGNVDTFKFILEKWRKSYNDKIPAEKIDRVLLSGNYDAKEGDDKRSVFETVSFQSMGGNESTKIMKIILDIPVTDHYSVLPETQGF